MKTFVIFQALFVLTGLIVNTGTELSLAVISPFGESTIHGLNISKDFECYAEVTLVCEVKPFIDSVTWQINGHTYALCVYQKCVTYPPFPENHNFAMDLANEVFNLTVAPVSISTNNNFYKCDDGITSRSVETKVKDVKICYCSIYIIIGIILVVHIQCCCQTLYSWYILYKTIPQNELKHSTNEYKMMAFLAGIPLVGFVLPIKTGRREVKQEEHESMKYFIFGISVTLTPIHPAVGMCVTSMFFLRSHKVTMAKSWKFMLFFGCLIVIGAEVFVLIQCRVLCWDETHYIPVLILYLVMLWIYMTATVVLMKYLLFIAGESQREEDSKSLCESCNKLVFNTYCMGCEKFLCVRCMNWHRQLGHDLLRHQQHNDERERELCCDSCKESGNYISAAHAFCLTCSAYVCTLCLKTKHTFCTLLWIQKLTDETGEELCCEEIENHTELPLEGVCLTCESYICKRCLKNPTNHRTHHVASHQQDHSTTVRRLHMCCDSVKEQETINYCLDCQCYFCCNSFATHRQHRLFWSQSENSRRASSRFLCRGCNKYKRIPVECYNLHNDEFLCAKCFESYHKSSPTERKQIYTNIDTLVFKDRLREKMYPCQIHTEKMQSTRNIIDTA